MKVSQFTKHIVDQAALVKKHFNSITPENVRKWERIHSAPDEYNFGPSDRYEEFGYINGMLIMGRNLVWHQQTPRRAFEDGHDNSADRATLLARIGHHIHHVVGHYKGCVKGWDMVNRGQREKFVSSNAIRRRH